MTAKAQKTCPICDKPTAQEFRPFCSKACAGRDLLAWLGESYRLPGTAPANDLEEDQF